MPTPATVPRHQNEDIVSLMKTLRWLVSISLVIVGCGGGTLATSDAGGRDAPSPPHDAGAPTDTNAPDTAVPPSDTGIDAASSPIDGGGTTTGRWVMGYYPGYLRSSLPADEIDFTSMTHLAVGAALPRTGGMLDTSFDIDATNRPIFARDLADRAHAAGRHPI